MSTRDLVAEGYTPWEGHDPFEDHCGPMMFKKEDDTYRCAFIIGEKHINGQGGLHGGMMMTFADFSLFVIARDHLRDSHAVTVSFTSDFASPGLLGEFVEATGEVIHETRKMLFIRGTIFTEDRMILRFSGVLKKIKERAKTLPD